MAGTTQTLNLTPDQKQQLASQRIKVLANQEAELVRGNKELNYQVAEGEIKLKNLNEQVRILGAEMKTKTVVLEKLTGSLKELEGKYNEISANTVIAKNEAAESKANAEKATELNRQATLSAREIRGKIEADLEDLKKQKETFQKQKKTVIDYLKNIRV